MDTLSSGFQVRSFDCPHFPSYIFCQLLLGAPLKPDGRVVPCSTITTARERWLIVESWLELRNYYACEKKTGVHRSLVRYYIKKELDPSFHCGSWGRKECKVFQDYEKPIIHQEILTYLSDNPEARATDLHEHLTFMLYNREFSIKTMNRLLGELGWSWRVPIRFQTYKYSESNLAYYADYLAYIQDISYEKIKFVDEAHFTARTLATGKKVLGLVGKRSYTHEKTLHCKSASLTLLTTLTGVHPVVLDYREESNTQWDFVEFVLACCAAGDLKPGDYLVADNSSVHVALDSYPLLQEIFDYFGVTLVKLPAYSPELNPCELCFSKIRLFLRHHNVSGTMMERVVEAAIGISHENIFKWYKHCINPNIILPEIFL